MHTPSKRFRTAALAAAGVTDVNVSFPAPTVAETLERMERFAAEVMANA